MFCSSTIRKRKQYKGLKLNYKYIITVAVLVLSFILINKCVEQEPEIVVKEKVVYKTVTDTITKVEIKEVPKVKYVTKVQTVKGKDSIVYVSKETNNAIEVNEYNTELKSNNATANLKILTTGELIDVKGSITYKQKETTIETIKKRNKSGLFIYGETSIQPALQRYELGLDYQFKNTIILGVSTSYNDTAKQTYFNAKIGIKIL